MMISIFILMTVSLISVNVTAIHYSHPVKYIEPVHANIGQYFRPTSVPFSKYHATARSPIPIVKQFTAAPPPFIFKQFSASPVKYSAPHIVKYNPHAVPYNDPHSFTASASPVRVVKQFPTDPANYAPPQLAKFNPYGTKYAAPHPPYEHNIAYDTPPQYEYAYNVHDQLSGDVKSHTERRNGDSVVGSYTVLDPDGFKRIVEYTADAQHGFNAVVRREPIDRNVGRKTLTPEPHQLTQNHPQNYNSGQPHRIFYNVPLRANKITATPSVIGHTITPFNYSPKNLKYHRRGDAVFKLIEPHHNDFRHK